MITSASCLGVLRWPVLHREREWEGGMKNQMALAVFLKGCYRVAEDCCDWNSNSRPAGFLRPSRTLYQPDTIAKVVKASQRPGEVKPRKAWQKRNKVKNREEMELEETRRMPLCVIVRTNWHLGSLICWQALQLDWQQLAEGDAHQGIVSPLCARHLVGDMERVELRSS